MTYTEAVDHLYALGPELVTGSSQHPGAPAQPPRKFDLAHMRTLCAHLGDPQDKVPSVLIAGTNGKGSTAATLASIFNAAGYRTGLYTSPHLVRPNERIQLSVPVLPSEYGNLVARSDGPLTLAPIPDDDFARLYTRVEEACHSLTSAGRLPVVPSFFERMTALAFLFFAEPLAGDQANTPRAEILILEVGLGGRLDATNVVNPLLSIITDIALDHQEYLGHTIAEITAEKCGILRPQGTLVTLPQLPEANHAIGIAATSLHVRAINAAHFLPPPQRNGDNARVSSPAEAEAHASAPSPSSTSAKFSLPAALLNRYTLSLPEGMLQVSSPLAGQHQQRNIALALAAALEIRNQKGSVPHPPSNQNGYELPIPAIEAGIRDTVWPGRLEIIAPNLLLDVAHNPAGAWTLRAVIASLPPEMPRTLIFSCLRDKSLQEMSRILFPLFDSSPGSDPARRQDHIILTPIHNARAASAEDLLAAAAALGIPAHVAPHGSAALAQARQITPANGIILATGSVYLVGEIRQSAFETEA